MYLEGIWNIFLVTSQIRLRSKKISFAVRIRNTSYQIFWDKTSNFFLWGQGHIGRRNKCVRNILKAELWLHKFTMKEKIVNRWDNIFWNCSCCKRVRSWRFSMKLFLFQQNFATIRSVKRKRLSVIAVVTEQEPKLRVKSDIMKLTVVLDTTSMIRPTDGRRREDSLLKSDEKRWL